MHRGRGDTSWSAWLITILAVPLVLRIRAPLVGRHPRNIIGCAGLDTRRLRIRGSPVAAFLKTSPIS
ncbi:hypothetical protein PR002_g32791 [Phytophthora rubi]|uniref:RxLR effector protein n=1 Tax=Phytophthora rubi TaxID=129364 RepID=A0A6A3G3Y0_9STRA|nr:hypothetical protein PR002_g32791 [Phytophthora rubi]